MLEFIKKLFKGENRDFPDTIHCMIPAEKQYSSFIYTSPGDCYLSKVLKNLGYKDLLVSPNNVYFYNNSGKELAVYKIDEDLYPARVKRAFDNNECIHIKLIKI